MSISIFKTPVIKAWLGAAALCIGAGAFASPVHGQMLHGAPGAVPYISGGIGKEDVQRMERESRPYNLRMAFSEGRHNEFIAGAHLHITDTKGREVFKLADAGPITDVKLPAGRYRVDVTYEGHTRTSQVMLKDHQPLQLNLHWAGDGQEA